MRINFEDIGEDWGDSFI